LLAEAGEHLRRGAARLESAPDRYRQRVEFVRAGLTFTRLLVANIGLMSRYWRQPDEGIAEQVQKNWQAIEALCEEQPFAVHWGPVRPQTPRMRGLHPDFPNPKWKLTRKSSQSEAGLDRD
jgi:hypothetical protein